MIIANHLTFIFNALKNIHRGIIFYGFVCCFLAYNLTETFDFYLLKNTLAYGYIAMNSSSITRGVTAF